ncbi:tRNA-(ms[2]io[6]A)-hydroxylase [Tenacibaculum finnmarkense]|uniref:tRNA 2-methylthio-N6-isopentenyl adenosine(37) hydroxylase MiaE n=1 Tax=Tenacibaculum finnmarkense genomovar finnmarkense TaxID=1458503 RepID=A0AAP1WFW0_9FLAO|nr:tRNA-(ms[2]io[6]A)-hydroxylase [Tenacibaculum finnmarkense]MBE7652459.1 tRNA 2-methylthio-N6-isopentenyl adenosine(37) hydroxylase MiaE [Tenacibaculum finnmarkense genomovar finnmarkense]MBE7660499.1 tRNA 2-methylthio-N6-isopentenyl adenosine(37) hydroxylase MiaE [Tenacibaculum finnmarkense genomovar finnmarkense]MBE7693392.1 tRNA 2-methylthio-N6-isopentenyl adenosine(37) hydroxylase MiaE [Tenacibaculum finnmarkense genomovar finnmarkense]MBE7694731.1 tRNA 2-methylthio-N6-isopentenyl adenosi
MLGLQFETETSWADIAKDNLQQILTDHAFLEQKAASNAVSLIINYSEETELVQSMSEIAIEEMEHFKMVHDFMVKRGMVLGREQKNDYAIRLQKFFTKTKDRTNALVQRLLIAALIEARSCERFKVFSENMEDQELSKFYKDLMISEANHYTIFLGFARKYQDKEIVDKKWNDLVNFEAEMMKSRGSEAKIHG